MEAYMYSIYMYEHCRLPVVLCSSPWYELKTAIILAEQGNILVQRRDIIIPGRSFQSYHQFSYSFHPTLYSTFFNLRFIKFDTKLTSFHKPLHIATVFKITMIHPVLMVMRNNVQYHRAQIYPLAFVCSMLLDALNQNARS